MQIRMLSSGKSFIGKRKKFVFNVFIFNKHRLTQDDGGGGDNWNYKSCKAPVIS